MARLLAALATQTTDGEFDIEVVVVENDTVGHAAQVVAAAQARTVLPLRYELEPQRNISLARNRAIRLASGNLVALIDDDEVPGATWLQLMRRTLRQTAAHGVLGPVVPDLSPDAPAWLRDGGFCDRPRHITGTEVGPRDSRTGNALLTRSVFESHDAWFDPALGRTGGEDSEFFARLRAKGLTFVWCDEATVVEEVPPERWTERFHLKRMWRSGTISGVAVRAGAKPTSFLVKSLLWLSGCILVAPLTVVCAKHVRMRVALKFAYASGVVVAAMGFAESLPRE